MGRHSLWPSLRGPRGGRRPNIDPINKILAEALFGGMFFWWGSSSRGRISWIDRAAPLSTGTGNEEKLCRDGNSIYPLSIKLGVPHEISAFYLWRSKLLVNLCNWRSFCRKCNIKVRVDGAVIVLARVAVATPLIFLARQAVLKVMPKSETIALHITIRGMLCLSSNNTLHTKLQTDTLFLQYIHHRSYRSFAMKTALEVLYDVLGNNTEGCMHRHLSLYVMQ